MEFKARTLGEWGQWMERCRHWKWVSMEQEPWHWTSNSTGDTPAVDEYGDDNNENDTTSVEDGPIPGTADLSITDTVSEITDDGKVRGRSNTVTASDKTTLHVLSYVWTCPSRSFAVSVSPLPSLNPPCLVMIYVRYPLSLTTR